MSLLSVNSSRLLILSLPLAFFLASCSDSTTGPGGGESAVRPAIGSTYTTAVVQIDPSGTPNEASRDTITATADELLTDYEGKDEVMKFTSKGGPSYIAYESNGDVAVQFLLVLQGVSEYVWLDLPVASGEDVDREIFNDTESQGGVTQTAVAHFRAENTGSKQVTINGETMTAQVIDGTITATFTFIAGGQENSMEFTYDLNIEFIPEIGMFSLYEIAISTMGNPSGNTARSTLIDFELK